MRKMDWKQILSLKTNHSEISSNINYRESDVDYDSYGFATGVTDSDENTKGRRN